MLRAFSASGAGGARDFNVEGPREACVDLARLAPSVARWWFNIDLAAGLFPGDRVVCVTTGPGDGSPRLKALIPSVLILSPSRIKSGAQKR